MDRTTIYSGQVPRTVDLLQAEQNAMVAGAKLAAAVFGTPTLVDAFTVTPTTPASLNVLLTPGSIYQVANLEATLWSALAADNAHSIVKQGIQLDPATFGITPPGTVGFSQVFLVEVQYQDLDSGATVLPYFNAAQPTLPFSGPGNAGTAQNTVRKGLVASQIKAGIAAATGSQIAPTADAGWTGLYTVTVANGATTITAGNITKLTTAPFLALNGYLPQIPTGVQNNTWVYAADTGTPNNLVVTISPTPTAYGAGMQLVVKAANTNIAASFINVNGLGQVQIVHRDSTPLGYSEIFVGGLLGLVHDGTNFQLAWTGAQPNTLIQQSAISTLYVNASIGNDSTFDGTSPTISGVHGPFLTIGKALTVMTRYDLAGFNFNIFVADGTYNVASPIFLPLPNGSGAINLFGNVANPQNVIVQSASGSVFKQAAGGVYNIQGVKPIGNGTPISGDNGSAFSVAIGQLNVTNVHLGAVQNYHFEAGPQGSIYLGPSGTITVDGNAPGAHMFAIWGGKIIASAPGLPAMSIPGAITAPWALCQDDSVINISYNGAISGAGNVTGKKFNATGNGVIDSGGQGASYLPGTVAGTFATGGQYL